MERLRLVKEGRMVSDVGERGLSLSGGFDLASNLRLLPKFNEHDPDVFFSFIRNYVRGKKLADVYPNCHASNGDYRQGTGGICSAHDGGQKRL